MSDPAIEPPRGTSTSTKVIATIVVLLAFFGGLVIGVIGDRIWTMHHGPGPRPFAVHLVTARILDRLDHELNLTPQQRTQVKQILDAHAQRIQGVWNGVQPQIRAEIDRNNAEIARVLNPDQRQKFERLKMQFLPRHIRPH